MASTHSPTPFSIDEFTSLVESALDLDHEPDVSMTVPVYCSEARISFSPSRRITSATTVFSKFKQLVSPPRPRPQKLVFVERPGTPIPAVSLMAPGSTEFVPFLPLASRRELEALQPSRSLSEYSVEPSSTESSPTSPYFPLTPTTYTKSICSSTEIVIVDAQSEDPFAKGSVQIINVTPPRKAKSIRNRTRPPPLNFYAPPSCPLPSPPNTPSPPPSRTSSNGSSYRLHPYASSDWTFDLPVSERAQHAPVNPLSPRRNRHKRTGSPFPLLDNGFKPKARLEPSPCHLVLSDNGLPMPARESLTDLSSFEANWVDMMDSDDDEVEDEDNDAFGGLATPMQQLCTRWKYHSDSELSTPVQMAFPLSSRLSLDDLVHSVVPRSLVTSFMAENDDDDTATTAYYSARSSLCSQFCLSD